MFDYGEIPNIACFNQAKTPLGVSFDALIAALQLYVTNYISPVWHTPARLFKTTGFVKGYWAMIFIDDSDVAGALGYHDLTPDGLPIAKVFVRTTLANGDTVGATAAHELVESLVDPAINMMTMGPDGVLVFAYEPGDPCENLSFMLNGIPMSDFVFPSYFESFRKPNSTRFDLMNKVTAPFQILHGGYQIVYDNRSWTQIFGSKEKELAFSKEDRRGHRSEARGQWSRKPSQAPMLEHV